MWDICGFWRVQCCCEIKIKFTLVIINILLLLTSFDRIKSLILKPKYNHMSSSFAVLGPEGLGARGVGWIRWCFTATAPQRQAQYSFWFQPACRSRTAYYSPSSENNASKKQQNKGVAGAGRPPSLLAR